MRKVTVEERRSWMTWMGRWSLRGDVLAGDQSHQLAGKHRDAEMPAAEARQRPAGATAWLATRRDEIINVLIRTVSHAASTPKHTHRLSLSCSVSLSLRLSVWLVTRRLTARSCPATARTFSCSKELSHWLFVWSSTMEVQS